MTFDARTFLQSVPTQPGVYIFLDANGNTLYVGKARNLKSRIRSYFRDTGLTPKTRLMVSRIARAEVQQTRSESEALLLENNLIKARKPRYNISLRDDKSFPYIRLVDQDCFPRFTFYRGSRSLPGKYFGPYPNAGAVREMLGHLTKIFRLRTCSDAFFNNRTRPCLQYQIRRCSAPCVGRISETDYRNDVRQARDMLNGQDARLMDELADNMESAAQALDFEAAATYRDRIALLQRIREQQYVSRDAKDADIVAVALDSSLVCFGVVSIRRGINLGAHFQIQPNHLQQEAPELLASFLPQHYLGSTIPEEILISHDVDSRASLQQLLGVERGSRVKIRHQYRGHRAKWVESARINTLDHLRRHLSAKSQIQAQFAALSDYLRLENSPRRIECFDISHTMGEKTVGACVVFDPGGPVKADYRRFNVTGIEPGDDYAAMRQVLTRRYAGIVEEQGKLPDLVIIDGGKGQLRVAQTVFDELGIGDAVSLLGVSKGARRKAGEETLHRIGQPALHPDGTSAPSHLVQKIRDEAHRFAITGHRQRRAKSRTTSALEQIEGIGEKRRQSLLRYFGGMHEVQRAAIEDIAKAPGISRALAEKIHARFHQG